MTMVERGHDGTDEAADQLRGHLHAAWSTVASGWEASADFIDAQARPVNDALLAAATPAPGDDVLELACGPGGFGLTAAPLVAPAGRVVMTDVAPEMVEIAGRRAQQAGLANVETRTADLEAIAEPDGAYDVVACREGLMFAVDPSRAFAEMRRVLKPGGRLAVTVWGPRDRNPWLGALLDAVSAHFGQELPPPGIPGPFSLSDAVRLRELAEAAGFAGVVVDEVELIRRYGPFDEWWERTSSLAGPVAGLISSLPADGLAALRERAAQLTRGYEADGSFDFPAVALRLAGRAPMSSTESDRS